MKRNMTKRTWYLIAILIAVIVVYGLAMGLYGLTLINGLWLIVACLSVATASAFYSIVWWRRLTNLKNSVVNGLCHVVAVTGLLAAIFLGVNYYARNQATTVVERVRVERVYSEKHYTSRRVGRNRYVRGDSYPVYYIDVALPGDYVKKLQIEAKDFRHYHVGDSASVKLAVGAFGFIVIER